MIGEEGWVEGGVDDGIFERVADIERMIVLFLSLQNGQPSLDRKMFHTREALISVNRRGR